MNKKQAVQPNSGIVFPTSFKHITINSGHCCTQRRTGVAERVAARLSQRISHGLEHEGWTDLAPFGEDTALHIVRSNLTLAANLYLPCPKPREAAPVIRMAVAVQPSEGAEAWAALLRQATFIAPGVPPNAPKVPWIAAVMDMTAAIDVDTLGQAAKYLATMNWAGDFERCLAWGFVHWLEAKAPSHLHPRS